MEITRYDDPAKFYADTEGYLVQREAEHNLLFGITSSLMADPTIYEAFYLAVVRDAGEIVAAMLRTPPHNLLLSYAPSDAIPVVVADVHDRYETLPGAFGPRETVEPFVEQWQQISGQQHHLGISQRIYQLESVVPVAGVPGAFRQATSGDRELLVTWFMEFEREAFQHEPDPRQAERTIDMALGSGSRRIVLWDHDGPASMAGATGPTPNGIRVGPVYTPPELRGRGYASACTAALSQQLLDEGRRYCFLFTDRSNATSNRIYQRIGYKPVVDVDEYVFADPRSAP